MYKLIKIILICMLGFFSFFELNAEKQPSKLSVLKVGTNAEFAPFSFQENNEIKGFEIDLARAICKKLHCEMKLIDMPFEALVPELISQSVDFVAAGMSMTPERSKVVAFTKPYLSGDPLVICYDKHKHSMSSLEEALSTRIVVNDGYTADFFITDVCHLKPQRIQSPIEAILALQSGRVDAYVLSESALKPLLKNQKKNSMDYLVIENTSEDCALMVNKKSEKLLKEINEALEELHEEGFIEELRTKWGL